MICSLPDATRRRFASPRHTPGRIRALFLAPRVALADSGRCWGVSVTPQDTPETLPRHLRDALGHHEASREGSGSYFKAILGGPGPLPASILDRYLHGPSPDRHSPARLGSSWSSTSYVYMRGPPPEDARKMLGSCSEIARGRHAARLLMLRPSGCSNLEQLSPKGLSRFWCDFA